MESTPVSRASLETRCGGIRLQSCPSTLSLDAVGLVFLFFTSAEWQSQRAMPTTFFLCFSQDSYGMPVTKFRNMFSPGREGKRSRRSVLRNQSRQVVKRGVIS
jgi:hypothetical protein